MKAHAIQFRKKHQIDVGFENEKFAIRKRRR